MFRVIPPPSRTSPRTLRFALHTPPSRGEPALLILGSVLLAATLGCSQSAKEAAKPAPPTVICVAAISQQITDFDEFVGRTEASETVDVRARVSGYLRTVEFTDGSQVAKDELLATIEPDAYAAAHQQAVANIALWNAKLTLAKATFQRNDELVKQAAISTAEYDESVAAVQEAEAQIAAAEASAAITQLDLNYTKILSPISGQVDRTFITPGNMVSGGLGSGTLLTRIVRDSPMYAYIDVDERSFLNYKRKTISQRGTEPGTPLEELKIPCYLQLQDEEDYPHEGLLDFAENRVDSDTGTLRIRAVYENTDGLLDGGLFVRVRIPTSQPYDGVLIPEQAIALDQADRVAYVVDQNNEVQRRVLSLGIQQGSLRAIKSGIQAGELVIYKGIQRVSPGMIVSPETTTLEPNNTAAPNASNPVVSDTSSQNP